MLPQALPTAAILAITGRLWITNPTWKNKKNHENSIWYSNSIDDQKQIDEVLKLPHNHIKGKIIVFYILHHGKKV